MHSRISVYLTNADCECVRQLYTGDCRDIAESVAVKAFKQAEYLVDFMVVDMTRHEILAVLWSQRSKTLRGECS